MERRDAWPEALAKWLEEAHDTNPYASAEAMRAWDAVIRNALADALEQAASRWRAWYREAHAALPTPSRDHPFPDAAQLALVKELLSWAGRLSDQAAATRALEMPAHDRVFNRLRDNDRLLEELLQYDAHLASCAESLTRLAMPGPLSEEPARRSRAATVLRQLDETIRARQEALVPRMPG